MKPLRKLTLTENREKFEADLNQVIGDLYSRVGEKGEGSGPARQSKLGAATVRASMNVPLPGPEPLPGPGPTPRPEERAEIPTRPEVEDPTWLHPEIVPRPTAVGASLSVRSPGGGTTPETYRVPSSTPVEPPQPPAGNQTLTELLSTIYPIGCIYQSVVSTSPATLFGFGTWAALGPGQVLVGIDAGDVDFDTVEETGGGKTATHTNNHSGGAVTAGTTGIAVADHPVTGTGGPGTTEVVQGGTGSTVASSGHIHNVPALAHAITDGGHGHAFTQPTAHGNHNIMNPYIVVYRWKRTA